MKRMKRILAVAALVSIAAEGSPLAQTQAAQTQKTIGMTMGVYVFPTKGQSSTVQNQDEGQCYAWAVKETGVDPFQLQKQSQQQIAAAQQQTAYTEGAGARGAAKGAAGGALIGAIAGDAGKGAAIGAATGFVAGRIRKRHAEENAAQQTAQTQAATSEQMDGFKKAFSACLEGKQYTVKY